MADETMIVKKEHGRVSVKVKRMVTNGYSPNTYMKVLNPNDYNDLALLFEDLELLLGAPIDKAYLKFKDKKNRGFPFF